MRSPRPSRARRLSPAPALIEPLERRALMAGDTPILSEFVASNSNGLADRDGDHSDWIELYNPTAMPIDLTGWSLTDDDEDLDKWRFPAVVINPSEFLVVFASDKNRRVAGAELHTNFKLSAGGGFLALVKPDGTVADAYAAYPRQTTDVSMGASFDSTRLIAPGARAAVRVPTNGSLEGSWTSPDYVPDGSWTYGRSGVGYGILQPGFRVDYYKAAVGVDGVGAALNVIANPALQSRVVQTSADVINYLGTGAPGNFAQDQPFPTQSSGMDVDDFVVDATGVISIPSAGAWSFGVNSDDGFRLELERNGVRYVASFDGLRGAEDTIQVVNIPEAGNWNVRLVYFEHQGGSGVEFFAAAGDRPTFDGGAFRLVGAPGGLAVGSVLDDDPGDDALTARFVADDLAALGQGGAVSAWYDRDPDGNGLVVAAAAGVPVVNLNALNGHATVRFNPTNGGDALRIAAAASPLAGAADFSAAVVFRATAPGTGPLGNWYANAGLVDAFGGANTNGWGLAFDEAGRVSGGLGNPDVSAYSTTSGLNDGKAHVAVVTRAGGVLSLYVDGRLEARRDDASVFPRDPTDLVLGSIRNGSGFFNGEIAEVRLYDNDLTESQVSRLARELDATYGLPGVAVPTVATDVRGRMQGVNATAYIRIEFDSPDPSLFEALSLRMKYDDGFVAYLNGVEVARRNAPASPAFDSSALGVRDADPNRAENIGLTAFLGLLREGRNVLAIRGLNASAGDEDFLIQPELTGLTVHADARRFFAVPTPEAANADPYAGVVAPVAASVRSGFFASPFNLALSTPTAGAQIRYTLDGSEPTATHGFVYGGPIEIGATTTVRANAFAPGYLLPPSISRTYLFLDDVIRQSPDGSAPAGWPTTWKNNVVDYGMDPDVVNSPQYGGDVLKAALLAIPSISITTDLANLFDPEIGIYSNAYQQGIDWEREAGVELINPDGSAGFGVNAGLRIRGGYSRSDGNPKHAFRLFFRGEYGASSLDFPLFGKEGAGSFEKVDLRTAQNYSWSFGGDPSNNFIAEVFARDSQAALGQPYTRSRFYHLYLNGQYWGLFQTEERPDANYAATYFGGDKDDYDVIKVESGPYTTQATDGNFDAWTRLWQGATDPTAPLSVNANYFRLQGKNPDGSDNPNYEVLLDQDNLIDYMIITLHGGNLDAPISAFLGNGAPNNFFAIRSRVGRQGFQFIQHDAEHTLRDVNENRMGPFPAGQFLPQFNPQYLHQQLMANATYRAAFADRVQELFFDGGAFTTEAAVARFQARVAEIDQAIIGESARWGDSYRGDALTRADWLNAVSYVRDYYLPTRREIFLEQLREVGLLPRVAAPTFSINGSPSTGGDAAVGDLVRLLGDSSAIYYTLDGSDPRSLDGGVSPSALFFNPNGSPSIRLAGTTLLKARVLSAAGWSALESARFTINVPAAAGNLIVTEINYNPHEADVSIGEAEVDPDEFEFIDLRNVGDSEINLAGVRFTAGIVFDFTGAAITSLAPGAYVVLVKNIAAFRSRYGLGRPVAGSYGSATGGLASLSNGGERLTLVDASGATIEDFTYDDVAPWPTSPDGHGKTLVRVDPPGDPNVAANWRAGRATGGRPGEPENASPTITPIADRTIDEDGDTGPIAFTIGDADSPADSLVLTVASDNPLLLPAGSVIVEGQGASRTIRIVPAANLSGSAVLTLTLADPDGGVRVLSFRLTVAAVNDAPVSGSESYEATEDVELVVPVASGVLANDSDVDGPSLTAVVDAGPAHGTLTMAADGSFRYRPDADFHGTDSFTYHATDGTRSGQPITVSLVVASTPDAPRMAPLAPRTVEEGKTLAFTVAATDPDLPDDRLTFGLAAGSPPGATIDPATGAFSWKVPVEVGPTAYTVTVTVRDSTGHVASQTFTITVREVNTPPTLAPIPDVRLDEGGTVAFVASATDPDLPGNTITYRLAAGAPAGARIDARTGAFSWTPTEAQGPGSYVITVIAGDGGLTDSKSFRVTVGEVNRRPILTPVADRTIPELATLSFSAFVDDFDLPVQRITFALASGAPAGARIDGRSGVFTWTPTEAQGPGVYKITILVNDDGTPALSDSRSFRVTVTEANRPAVLAPIADATVFAGSPFSTVVRAVDPDQPPSEVRYTLAPGSPAGATIDPTSGEIRWTAALTPGRYPITVRATEAGFPDSPSSRTFVVTVVDAPPNVDVGGAIALGAGDVLTRAGRFEHPGQGPFRATVDYGDGSGVQLLDLASDRTFVLSHLYAAPGDFTAIVRVAGPGGVEGVATLAVAVASRPTVAVSLGGVTPGRGPRAGATIALNFSGPVDPTSAAAANVYEIVNIGRDRRYGTADDRVVAYAASAAVDSSRRSVRLLTRGPLPANIGALRLVVRSGAVRDGFGRPIDGDGDGRAGGDFVAALVRRRATPASAFQRTGTPNRAAVRAR